MTTPHLHVLALDGTGDIWHEIPDAGTGWCWLTVPRPAIFGKLEAQVKEWDYGIMHAASTPAMAIAIARRCREIQGLDYLTGPAVVMDDTAVRLNSMVELLHHEKRMGDGTLHFQHRDDAEKVTDANLDYLSMNVEHDNIRMAVKHGLALLRRAKRELAFAHELWPYPASGRP